MSEQNRHEVKLRRPTAEEDARFPNGITMVAECSYDSEIGNLEFRVVEAAVRFRRAETALWVESEVGTSESAAQAKTERARAYIAFVDAVDALIAAREAELKEE